MPLNAVGNLGKSFATEGSVRFRLAGGSIIPAWPRRLVHAKDRIMHDERQRPREATGSTCAVAENKIGEDPKQLELWSAAQSNNAAIGTRQQRGASIDNTRPTRAPGQGAAPKFPLTEPIVSIRQAASSFDHEIRAPLRDELLVSAPSAGAQWFHPALVTGALAVALGLGWIGGSSSSLFLRPRSGLDVRSASQFFGLYGSVQ